MPRAIDSPKLWILYWLGAVGLALVVLSFLIWPP